METISQDGITLSVLPSLGGAVASLTWDGRDILRSAPEGATSPLECAAFPLVPFCGRIDQGKFVFDGVGYDLPKNFPPEPHAIHGFGWQREWQVGWRHHGLIALLHVMDKADADWPWTYEAGQVFRVGARSVYLAMWLKNTSDQMMPGGLGWHPYFDSEGAMLKSSAETVWTTLDPTRPLPVTARFDLQEGRKPAEMDIDHAFSGEKIVSYIRWTDGVRMSMKSTPQNHLVVYTPDAPFFCVEPLTHTPNAVNIPRSDEVTGLKWLAPGEEMTLQITIRLSNPA